MFLQRINGQLRGQEEKLVYQHCIVERIPYLFFELDDLNGPRAPLSECLLLVGSVEAVGIALQLMNVQVPMSNYYPDILKPFLHRNVWLGNKKEVIEMIDDGKSVFAKSVGWKQLTGMVFSSSDVGEEFDSMSNDSALWLADPVCWLSEYRVYVIKGGIVATCFYGGDDSVSLKHDIISRAVELFYEAHRLASFAIDFGVIDTGETALVEVGDGWAMGAYKGISAKLYFDFVRARWDEMVSI